MKRVSLRIIQLFKDKNNSTSRQTAKPSLIDKFFNPQVYIPWNKLDGTDPYLTDIVHPDKRADFLNWPEERWQLYLNRMAA